MFIHGRSMCVFWLIAFLVLGACSSSPKKKEFPEDFSAEELRDTGVKFLGAGDTGKALKYLDLSEKKNDKDPDTQYYLALAYNARNLPDKALEHFQKAIELKPDYSEAYNAMGAFYARQGKISQAQEAFRKALNNPFYETPHYALFNLARLYEKRGDSRKALSVYEEALRLQPSYAAAHFRRGRILEATGQKEQARRSYGQAIHYDPTMASAQFHYGRLSYLMGDQDTAFTSLSQVVILDPRSSLAKAAKEYLDKMHASTWTERQY